MRRALSILLIEDDPAHVELVRRGLQPFEGALSVSAVSSLAEARRYLMHLTPDIAIADLNLPDGQGLELVGENPKLPVMILTGCENTATEAHSLQAGAIAYVVKNEDAFLDLPHTLLNAYQKWHAGHTANAEISERVLCQPSSLRMAPVLAFGSV